MYNVSGHAFVEKPYSGIVTPTRLHDASRWRNHGVHTNITMVQLPSGLWVPSFNGSTSKIACGADQSIANIWDGGGTAIIWVKLDSDGEASAARLFRKIDGWEIFCDTDDGSAMAFRWIVTHSDTNGDWKLTSRDYTLGTWAMLALTYNSDDVANNPIFYLNAVPKTVGSGITETTTPIGTRTDDSAVELIIGNLVGQTHTLDGKTALLGLCNYILSPGQIKNIYEKELQDWFI